MGKRPRHKRPLKVPWYARARREDIEPWTELWSAVADLRRRARIAEGALLALLDAVPQAKALLTRRDAARALGVSERTLRRWTQAGRIKHVERPGRGRRPIIRYRYDDLLASLATSGRKSTGSRFETARPTTGPEPRCTKCARFRSKAVNLACDEYPDGIPSRIIHGARCRKWKGARRG